MFHGDRWASAFINTLGENAGAGLACLKALAPPLQSVRGALFGRTAALQLEKILREAAGALAATEMEYAIRFIVLLVEKKSFPHIDSIIERIEQTLDERNGILNVTAESVAPLEAGFAADLERLIKERTGAAGIKLRTKVRPELLGGYRLRIGGFYVDASLKGQLEQLSNAIRS